jgi:drug/metabolite transporter (DMT)-like permease
VPVFHLLAYRFTLATLVLAPLVSGAFRKLPLASGAFQKPPLARSVRWTPRLLADGAALGLALFAGFALQTAGLLWTTPSRSAFLTGLSVMGVPFLGRALGRPLPLGPLAGTLCAAAGLWVLYRPAVGGAGFGRGDALTVACAVVFAVYVLLVERAVARHPIAPLALLQFGLIALLSLPSLVLRPPSVRELTGYPLFASLLMGIVATAGAFLCQLYAQRHLTAVEAGVILALEPVLAALTSVVAGAEQPTGALALGGALVVAAMLITEVAGGPQDASPPLAATPRS